MNNNISITNLKMKKGRNGDVFPSGYQSVADRAKLEVKNLSFSLLIMFSLFKTSLALIPK